MGIIGLLAIIAPIYNWIDRHFKLQKHPEYDEDYRYNIHCRRLQAEKNPRKYPRIQKKR